jgi:hypothetical protein
LSSNHLISSFVERCWPAHFPCPVQNSHFMSGFEAFSQVAL